jgi:hypothetical protein
MKDLYPREVAVKGSDLVIDDVIYDRDESLPLDERGRWTQLCGGHADQLEKEPTLGLISDGGSGICGVKGCTAESDFYFDF